MYQKSLFLFSIGLVCMFGQNGFSSPDESVEPNQEAFSQESFEGNAPVGKLSEYMFAAKPDFSELACFNTTQMRSLENFAQGCIRLFLGEPRRALDEFEVSFESLNTPFSLDDVGTFNCDDFRNSSFEHQERVTRGVSEALKAVVLLGKVIAYDMLDSREQVERTLGLFLLTASNCDSEELEDDEFAFQDPAAIEFFRNLVMLAPSEDVRGLLLSFVDELAEDEQE